MLDIMIWQRYHKGRKGLVPYSVRSLGILRFGSNEADLRIWIGRVCIPAFALKFTLGMSVTNVPSNSHDAKILASVVVAGSGLYCLGVYCGSIENCYHDPIAGQLDWSKLLFLQITETGFCLY